MYLFEHDVGKVKNSYRVAEPSDLSEIYFNFLYF